MTSQLHPCSLDSGNPCRNDRVYINMFPRSHALRGNAYELTRIGKLRTIGPFPDHCEHSNGAGFRLYLRTPDSPDSDGYTQPYKSRCVSKLIAASSHYSSPVCIPTRSVGTRASDVMPVRMRLSSATDGGRRVSGKRVGGNEGRGSSAVIPFLRGRAPYTCLC